jgi:hypothetical protein
MSKTTNGCGSGHCEARPAVGGWGWLLSNIAGSPRGCACEPQRRSRRPHRRPPARGGRCWPTPPTSLSVCSPRWHWARWQVGEMR